MAAAAPVAGLLGLAAPGARAQAPAADPVTELEPVVVTARRAREASFDAPAAISAIGRDAIEAGGLQVNLSESLVRVPGITVLNRQNYAQDLQLSIRGFGSRSTFGIRGVRLIVDGIPATMPDGQGQVSTVALASAGRVEVLRGPLAQLYGNAAGGVVQVFTEADATRPTVSFSAGAGRYHQGRVGLKFSTTTPGGQGITVDASHFETDGYREHSAAQRGQLNARWQAELSRDTSVSVVLNALDQPVSQDPLGLTRAQFEADPRQAVAVAFQQDARKTVRQSQVGTVVEHRLAADSVITARLYGGQRALDNALSVPPAAQAAATSAGGIVAFDRTYSGLGLQWAHRVPLGEARALNLVGGVEYDRAREDRRGYLNNGGVQGALKRSELNRVDNRDAFAQARLDFATAWSATLGVRRSEVAFRTDDRYIVAGNPDDSGRLSYQATNPVIGLSWRATPALNLYANAGRGFETPTFTELAYRNGGTGLNTALQASRSTHSELGAKWRLDATQRVDLALFDIRTRDEIVVDTNVGGRSTFKNAGRTRRTGLELGWVGQLGAGWRATLSLTQLRARFDEAFVSGSGASAVTVPAGSRLAGAPERSAYAELAWQPRAAWGGFNAAAELVHVGRIVVNDVNDDAAAAATVVNLRAGFAQQWGAWRFTQLLRLDNAGDRRYAGSVIVNEGNRRYFEPALPRNALVALSAQRRFD
ncbi:TonB-dependent receptor [Piscinibacter sakaiensis]|uniref:TonB-dependent receptor n=1 Tax=Piscinibacter sakaiensis TaxID=1547922 RepID=A0A0K8NZK5_PISS1|nr:TonB-dependent receptor [Piscinibacter sakaiensis]